MHRWTLPVTTASILLLEDIDSPWAAGDLDDGPVGRPARESPGVVIYSGVQDSGTAQIEIETLEAAPEVSAEDEARRDGWVVFQEFSTVMDQPWHLGTVGSFLSSEPGVGIPVIALSGRVRVRLLARGRDLDVMFDSPPSREEYRVVVWPEASEHPEVRSGFDDYIARTLPGSGVRHG